MDQGRIAVGHPVDVASGAVFTISHDFLLPGTMELLWSRHYATNSSADAWLGRGWIVPYFMRLDRTPDGYRLLDEGGSFLVFPVPDGRLPVGGRVISLGANMELRREKYQYTILHWHHGGDAVEQFVFEAGDEQSMPLSWVENLAGHRIRIHYDRRGRPAQIAQELEGRTVELTYGFGDLISSVQFVTDKGPRKLLVSYEYDKHRRLVGAVDGSGNRTSYSYDSDHRLVQETNPLGSTFSFDYDSQGRCIHSSGDGGYMARRLQYRTVPHMTRVTDSLGNTTGYYLNPAGQVIQEVSPLGAAWTREYDEYGRLVAEADPEGAVQGYQYDDRGDRVAMTFADGGESHFAYNDLHRLVEYTNPMGRKWTYEYDERGNVLSLTNPLGHRLTCTRDGQGLVTQSRMPGGLVITREYGPRLRWVEASDQISLLSRVEYDEFGNQTASYDAHGLVQSVSYDTLNQPVEVVDKSGRVTRVKHNALGELVEWTDPQLGWERREYDRFGQLVTHINVLGQMRLEYDTEGRLTAVVNRASERLERAFDADGRMVEEKRFDGRIEKYEYNPRDELVRVTKSDGRTIDFTHDKVGALIGRESSDGLREEWAYDKDGDLIGAKNGDAAVELIRNELGNVVAEVQNGRRIEYEYDPDSHRIGRRLADFEGSALSFKRDVRGRMVSLIDRGGVCQELRWDELDRVVERRFLGRVVEELAYNIRGWIRERKVSSNQEGSIVARCYEYDDMDCVTWSEDQRRGQLDFKHDGIGRLTEVLGQGKLREFYRYDANGSVLETHRGRRVVVEGGKTLADGPRWYAYDGDGCLSRVESPQDGLELSYDVDGQLVRVRRSDGVEIRYTYDPLGRRTSKEVDGVRTEFLWEGCVLAAEIQDDEISQEHYFHSLEPLAQWRGTERFLPVTDLRGAVLEVLNEQGRPLWACTLDSYGNVTEETGSPASPFRLRGQYHDRETGFYYNFYRTYAPELGDYLSPDPIGLKGGSHFYSYPRNPLVWDDPFGLRCSSKGAEKKMDKAMKDKGYEKVSVKGKNVNANGIDGVYYKKGGSPEYVIAEAKSGRGYLHKSGPNKDIQQMSDAWINGKPGNSGTSRLESAFPPGSEHYNNIQTSSDVERWVYHPHKEPDPVYMKGKYGGPNSPTTSF
jgi:RHS repeat-associated protein